MLYRLTCTERSQCSQSTSRLGLRPCGGQGSGFSLCFYHEVPGGHGMYSNNYNVMGFFIMSFEMKHRQIKSKKAAGEQRAPCSNPVARCSQYTGNAHIHWSAWEWGPVSEGPALSSLLPAAWAFYHHRHISGFRQMQPTTSKREELLSARLQDLAKMNHVPCNMHY